MAGSISAQGQMLWGCSIQVARQQSVAKEMEPAVHHKAWVLRGLFVWSVKAQSALPPITQTISASQKFWSAATSCGLAEMAKIAAMSGSVRISAHHRVQDNA